MKIYIIVFILKLFNGGLSNYRLLMMKDGNKVNASLTTVFSTITWTLSMAFVVGGFQEDPFIVLPFVFGVVGGNYLGVIIDNFFKSGAIMTTIIINEKNRDLLTKLKAQKFTVTSFIGEGMKDKKEVIIIATPRKKMSNLMNIMKNTNGNKFIINEKVEDVI